MRDLPKLYVEGKDDIGVINALLGRHGIDTARGTQHLFIEDLENIEAVLDSIPDSIRASTDRAVGFVVDIDVAITRRWGAVCDKLRSIGIDPPDNCPETGYIATLPGYRTPFGVWLMPDCKTDDTKLEHLIESLLPEVDPLWDLSRKSVARAAEVADNANDGKPQPVCKRFRDVDQIKAEVYTWLAWHINPGAPLGVAINSEILGCDSEQAIAFLRWLKSLYGFAQLDV